MKKELILVVNCGSSSLKFSLICLSTKDSLLTGIAERLGSDSASLTIKQDKKKLTNKLASPYNHQQAISYILAYLQDLRFDKSIIAIGHRLVHGGETYARPTLIDSDVINEIKRLSSLAPLHNPANLIGVSATQRSFPKLPQVAVFDTAFHQTIPAHAFLYALPYHLYQDHGLRRYGFHGTSHYYVAKEASVMLNKPFEQTNVITVHLGNGCSIAVIKNGQSVDTSMGLTPLEGLVMGTRSGDLDPGLILHLESELGYTTKQINTMLNQESGLKGISELSNDCRTLETAALEKKHPQARLALDVFCYRIAKNIAAYTAALSTLDAIVFTGGIGENSSFVRSEVCKHLSILSVNIDEKLNQKCRFGRAGKITPEQSRVCFVIPTNEEWVIAQQTQAVINKE